MRWFPIKIQHATCAHYEGSLPLTGLHWSLWHYRGVPDGWQEKDQTIRVKHTDVFCDGWTLRINSNSSFQAFSAQQFRHQCFYSRRLVISHQAQSPISCPGFLRHNFPSRKLFRRSLSSGSKATGLWAMASQPFGLRCQRPIHKGPEPFCPQAKCAEPRGAPGKKKKRKKARTARWAESSM